MTHIQAFLTHLIAGVVPVYFVILIAALGLANQIVKVAKWTAAQNLTEGIARGVLKIPVVGTWIATVPILGDVLHFIANPAVGPLPPTLLQRLKKPDGTIVKAAAILLIPALLFTGCGFGTCLLGKLKASYQTLLVDVAEALATTAWEAALAEIATSAGSDMTTCAVQSVQAYEAKKVAAKAATSKVPKSEIMIPPVLDHANQYLKGHPKVVCAQGRVAS